MCQAGNALALVNNHLMARHSQHHRETTPYRFMSFTTLNSTSKGIPSEVNDEVDDGDDDVTNIDEDIYKDFMPEDYSAEAKTSGSDDVDDIDTDTYFAKFISDALKEEETINIRLESKNNELKSSFSSQQKVNNDVHDDGDDIRRMIMQQQQQIDMLMNLVEQQGRQQLPSPQPLQQQLSKKSRIETKFTTTTNFDSAITKNVTPLKAMLFIDGTWLYYSLNSRNPKKDAIITKFGQGWQNNYKVDWQALPRLICSQIERQRNNKSSSSSSSSSTTATATSFSSGSSDRSLDISRVMVFTSAKKETDPNSIRMRMFREMTYANYDVFMMETIGQGEKCVDIQLAVEMLHYATVPNAYDVAILLSGDKDFVPALVRTRQKGKQVCIASMRAGCNRMLYESYPHIRDYDVVWLENCLNELIVPITDDERSRRDRAGYASSFTMMRVVRDFVAGATPNYEWVSSRDIGKYLKYIEIGDSNMLEELKQVHGGLRTFLMERGCNLFDVKFPDAKAIRGRGEFSFWVRVKGDSDASLLNEFKRTQYFTKEEKEFLENYMKEKFIADDSYEHTSTISHIVNPNSISDAEDETEDDEELWRIGDPPLEDLGLDPSVYYSSPPIDYSQLTVNSLKEICREKGLKVTGTKDVLIERLVQDAILEYDIIENRRNEYKQLKERAAVTAKKIRPKAIISTKSPPQHQTHLMPAGGNIYASTLPQMDMIRTARNPLSRGGSSSTKIDSDSAASPHLEALIKEYLTASGGKAGSRDIGRYLAANSDSRKGGNNRSALTELKENFGSLLAFIMSREDVFTVLDKQENGDDTGFPIQLKHTTR